MGRREEAVMWLKAGLSPDTIATFMGISLQSVLGYLDEMIGRGVIRRSDVYFSLDEVARTDPQSSQQAEIADRYGSAAHALGDMYEELHGIETVLHERIRSILVAHFGPEEMGWWRKGVPESIRKKCAQRREEDEEPVNDPYCYTDSLDLSAILDANWNLLCETVGDYRSDKKQLMRDLLRLNGIRRIVMHPVRGVIPSEQDFAFLRGIRGRLESKKERARNRRGQRHAKHP